METLLLTYYNRVLATGPVSAVLTRGYATPVFKKGDVRDTANYRRIVTTTALEALAAT